MCPIRGKTDTTNLAQDGFQRGNRGSGPGKLYLVGLGPGSLEELTPRAKAAIEGCQVVVGYRSYIRLIQPLLSRQRVISSGMGREQERAETAIDEALAGKRVVVCSSGDAGIYGCAGLALELLSKRGLCLPLEIIPGITAASSAAARLGAPLTNDFAVISLSDLLTPWGVIERRIKAALEVDLVLVLYNPKSRGRTRQIERVGELVLQHRSASTPVGIVSCAGQPGERVVVTEAANFLEYPIDMSSTVIIGNSTSFSWQGYMLTPRGYRL